jgi:hypothetical protein
MKILSYLNVSNLSNIEADSGFVFQTCLLGKIAERGHEVIFIVPCEVSNPDNRIDYVFLGKTDSKYGVRFGLNWEALKFALVSRIEDIDVLLVNQSELTIPLSVAITEMTHRRIPTVTYFHYLAIEGVENGQITYDQSLNLNNVAPVIWQRQIESALFSDHNIIGSRFGLNLFLEASRHQKELTGKFSVIPPPALPTENVLKNTGQPNNVSTIPRLIYNHRLYNHYGGVRVFDVLNDIFSYLPFQLLLTDPT